MERLKGIKEKLMYCIEAQVYGDLNSVDTKELGEAIDMLKDLEEAIYYCTITKAMEEGDKEKKEGKHHQEQMNYPYYMTIDRDMDKMGGRMYYPNMYTNGSSDMSSMSGNRNYPMEIRDYREGKSPMSRRTYMESKEMHKDGKATMHELDKYMQELSQDVVEMIEKATPEEKQLLQQKLTMLASKVK